MDEFAQQVVSRLAAMERTQAWLARKVRRSPSAVHHYLHGKRPWPSETKHAVAVLLDVKTEVTARARVLGCQPDDIRPREVAV